MGSVSDKVFDRLGHSFGSCEICRYPKALRSINLVKKVTSCPRCGTFTYDSGEGWIEVKTPDHMVRLSGWVRDQSDAGIELPNITMERSRQIREMRLPGLEDRALRALRVIAKEWPDLDGWYPPTEFASSNELMGRSYSVDQTEASVLLKLLQRLGFLNDSGAGHIQLSVDGLLELEKSGNARLGSQQTFVAMSFNSELEQAWTDGFSLAILAAGFSPMRIDRKEFVGGISDEIIAEIRRSHFLIADYTDHRHGVYFEAGYALGFGLTVIPTCRADHVNKLHFDIKHLNTLLWTTPEDLASKLNKRILAVIGNAS